MAGIIGIINKKKFNSIPDSKSDGHINEKISFHDIYLERKTLPKFLNDKVFFETDQHVFLIEGIIFNISDLKIKYKQNDWHETLIVMVKLDNRTFFNEFRGSFSGFYYDKIEKQALIFADHIGVKPLYYYEHSGEVLFASSINKMLEILLKNNFEYKMDLKGAYSLLTHGYMIEDLTPFEGLKRLKPGCYISIKNNEFIVKRYHRFTNEPDYKLNDDEIIDKLDMLFRQAVLRQTEKNKEYGFRDITQLSAGLDSRMTTWVASELGHDVLSITYSQSNFLDEIIPKKISTKLKINWLFKTLDNGLSLMYLDEIVKRNSGVVLYGGPAQVWDSFNLLDKNSLGVIHTGIHGNTVAGQFYQKLIVGRKHSIGDGAYSKFLVEKLNIVLSDYEMEDYNNREIFTIYNRGFNGANMGTPLTLQEFAESYSPYYDVDFAQFILTIPLEKRWNYYIYDKWVIKKYPDAAKYPHNERMMSWNKEKNYHLFGKDFTISQLFNHALKMGQLKVGLKKKSIETPFHMNPFDYWYATNSELKKYMDNYFGEYAYKVDDEMLRKDVIELYQKGNVVEKTQVLTLLAILKNYYFSNDWLNN